MGNGGAANWSGGGGGGGLYGGGGAHGSSGGGGGGSAYIGGDFTIGVPQGLPDISDYIVDARDGYAIVSFLGSRYTVPESQTTEMDPLYNIEEASPVPEEPIVDDTAPDSNPEIDPNLDLNLDTEIDPDLDTDLNPDLDPEINPDLDPDNDSDATVPLLSVLPLSADTNVIPTKNYIHNRNVFSYNNKIKIPSLTKYIYHTIDNRCIHNKILFV